MRRLGCWLRGALALLAWAAPAHAEESHGGTIVLVVDGRESALATRVTAELEALGFAVQRSELGPESAGLREPALSADAIAAIEIRTLEDGKFQVTVLDRVTGKTVRREITARRLDDPTTRELLALQSSELLRASLMEVEAPHPPRGDVPPTKVVHEVAAATRAPRRASGLHLGGRTGVLLNPGLSFAPTLELSAAYELAPRWRAALGLGGQLGASRRVEPEGELELLARWLELGAELSLLPGEPFTLGIDAGLTLVALSASGIAAREGIGGQARSAWVPAVHAGLGSALRVVDGVWWTVHPAAGAALIEPVLRVDGRDVEVWGRPWFECSTGVEVELP